MGARRQRWWDPEAHTIALVLSAHETQRHLRAMGFVPFTDRVHSRRFLVEAGITTLSVLDPGGLMHAVPIRWFHSWVPAWAERLLDGTFEFGDALWRGDMVARAHTDPEYRNAAEVLLQIGGPAALRVFARDHERIMRRLRAGGPHRP